MWIMYFCLFFHNIMKSNNFCIILLYCHICSLLFHFTRSLFVPYAYEPNDCILLSSFELKAILLISAAKTLCLSLLNICPVFNINLLFFHGIFIIFFETIYVNFIFFSRCFILFSSCF